MPSQAVRQSAAVVRNGPASPQRCRKASRLGGLQGGSWAHHSLLTGSQPLLTEMSKYLRLAGGRRKAHSGTALGWGQRRALMGCDRGGAKA